MWIQTSDGGAVNTDLVKYMRVIQIDSTHFAIDAVIRDVTNGTSTSFLYDDLKFRRLKHEDYPTYLDASTAIWRMTGAIDPSNIP